MTRLACGLVAAGLAIAGPASAHDVRGEVALLDIGDHAVDLELQVPVRQLEVARGAPLGPDPAAAVRAEQTALRADAAARIGATSRTGRPFTVAIRSIAVERVGDGDVVVVRAHLEAPDGDARWFVLRDDLVLGRVVTDTVYVFVRTDRANGIVDQAPRLIGYLHYQARTLIVDRGAGAPVPGLVERAAAGAGWLVVGLALAAIASWLARTRALRTRRW